MVKQDELKEFFKPTTEKIIFAITLFGLAVLISVLMFNYAWDIRECVDCDQSRYKDIIFTFSTPFFWIMLGPLGLVDFLPPSLMIFSSLVYFYILASLVTYTDKKHKKFTMCALYLFLFVFLIDYLFLF